MICVVLQYLTMECDYVKSSVPIMDPKNVFAIRCLFFKIVANVAVLQIAWAPGRGVKGPAFRSYWLLEEGVSYVPWSKVKSQKELASLAEGGWIDPATCPTNLEVPVKGAGTVPCRAGPEIAGLTDGGLCQH